MTRLFIALLAVSLFAGSSYAESPWLNSNIRGAVTQSDPPSLREDFYVHVNHGWLSTAQLKPGYSRNSAFNELQDMIDARLKAMMTDETLTGHDAQLVRTLYALWLDWDARNEAGVSELKGLVENLMKVDSLEALTAYFKTKDSFNHNVLIADFGLGRDNKDSESHNVELAAAGLSLGDSAEYREMTPNGERTEKMHDAVVTYMLRRLGYDEPEAVKFLERAFEFEKAIAAHMMTYAELRSPDAIDKMYNPLTLAELRKKSPVYPYAEILEAHSVQSRLMNLQQPEWLDALNKLYTPENLENIRAYLLCNLVEGYITITDEPAYREYQRLSRERFGITGSKPDDELAVDFVHGRLSGPVSRLYIAKYVPKSAKREVEQIIRDTVKYYKKMLMSEEWLSESTKQKAVEKLEAMRLNAAYPDKWVDDSKLEIDPKGSLIDALNALRDFGTKTYFYDRLNTKVDHDLWISDVVVVNSYYRPSENSINIIAGILGGDFYRADMSYEEKLGGIGAVIGHEVSHAFDTNGAQFDKTGNVAKWWTDEDYKEFQERADRLIKYFDGMTVTPEGTQYNGKLIHTEAIADMAGVKAMLGIAEEHEGFDYGKFFGNFAKIWKRIQTRERTDMVLKTDVHALPYLRVNATLQQYEEFHRYYGIREGDGMYLAPEDRIAVW